MRAPAAGWIGILMDGESKEKSEIETHHSPNDRINIYYFLNEL